MEGALPNRARSSSLGQTVADSTHPPTLRQHGNTALLSVWLLPLPPRNVSSVASFSSLLNTILQYLHNIFQAPTMLLLTLSLGFVCRCFGHTPHRRHPSQPLSLTLFPSWTNDLLLASLPRTIHPRLLLLRPTLLHQFRLNIQPSEHNRLSNPCLREHLCSSPHILHTPTNPSLSNSTSPPSVHYTSSMVCQTQHSRRSTSDA